MLLITILSKYIHLRRFVGELGGFGSSPRSRTPLNGNGSSRSGYPLRCFICCPVNMVSLDSHSLEQVMVSNTSKPWFHGFRYIPQRVWGIVCLHSFHMKTSISMRDSRGSLIMYDGSDIIVNFGRHPIFVSGIPITCGYICVQARMCVCMCVHACVYMYVYMCMCRSHDVHVS